MKLAGPSAIVPDAPLPATIVRLRPIDWPPFLIAPTTCRLLAASAAVIALLRIWSADLAAIPLLAALLELLELLELLAPLELLALLELLEPLELLPQADTATAATAATAKPS